MMRSRNRDSNKLHGIVNIPIKIAENLSVSCLTIWKINAKMQNEIYIIHNVIGLMNLCLCILTSL